MALTLHEAQAELIVDADAVLALSLSCKRFKAVPRRLSEIRQSFGRIKYRELSERRRTKIRRNAAALARQPQCLSIRIGEAPDHPCIITRLVKNGKR